MSRRGLNESPRPESQGDAVAVGAAARVAAAARVPCRMSVEGFRTSLAAWGYVDAGDADRDRAVPSRSPQDDDLGEAFLGGLLAQWLQGEVLLGLADPVPFSLRGGYRARSISAARARIFWCCTPS